jgi:hypothetical protein
LQAAYSLRGQRKPADPREFAISEAAKTQDCVMHGPSCDKPDGGVTVNAAYLDANEPIVKEQLQKAGVRLSKLLDTAFGN